MPNMYTRCKNYRKISRAMNLDILGVADIDDEHDMSTPAESRFMNRNILLEFNQEERPTAEKQRKRIQSDLLKLKKYHKSGTMLAGISDKILKNQNCKEAKLLRKPKCEYSS